MSVCMHRLFDSQNNNRGGYNVGKLYYYEGSVLSIEWWESFDRFTDLFFNEIYDDDDEVWIGKKIRLDRCPTLHTQMLTV